MAYNQNRPNAPAAPAIVMVCGVPIRGMRVFRSAYQGECMQSGKTINVNDLMVFKANKDLTDGEYNALYPSNNFPKGCTRNVTCLYDEVVNIPICQEKLPGPTGTGSLTVRQKPLGMPKEPPNRDQLAILARLWAKDKNHIIIRALAGCGKTNTLQRVAWSLKDKRIFLKELGRQVSLMYGRSVVYLAYNRRLRVEVEPKLFGTGVRAMTTHSFLLRALNLRPKDVVDTERLDRDRFLAVLCNRIKWEYNEKNIAKIKKESDLWLLRGLVMQLVAFVKHWAIMPEWTKDGWVFSAASRELIDELINKYKVLVQPDDRETVISLACSTIAVGIPPLGEKPTKITFEDMLYLPLVLRLQLPKLDMVLADEVQDFNMCQILLMRTLAENGTRLICVGDPNQAIYYFRGATGKSFDILEQQLRLASGKYNRGIDIETLSINYRSGCAVIENANLSLRDASSGMARLEGFKKDQGEVRNDVRFADMLDWLCENPAADVCILSRTNDPLFSAGLEVLKEFIHRGIDRKICILGKKGVGAPLTKLIDLVAEGDKKNSPCTHIADRKDKDGNVIAKGLMTRLRDYFAEQMALWGHDENYTTVLERLQSHIECIEVVCEMVTDNKVESVINTIKSLVTDEPKKGTVIFSTVHGAKGLEWKNVFVIRCDLFPFPKVAMYDREGNITEEFQEELNIIYVRDTRPILNLYYVLDWIEKDRMAPPVDVSSLLNSNVPTNDTVDEELDEMDWGGVEEGNEVALPPVPAVPAVEAPQDVYYVLEDDGTERAVPKSPKKPKSEVVKSQKICRKWVDTGKPF